VVAFVKPFPDCDAVEDARFPADFSSEYNVTGRTRRITSVRETKL
jgi:hypothetical protein